MQKKPVQLLVLGLALLVGMRGQALVRQPGQLLALLSQFWAQPSVQLQEASLVLC